MSSQISGPPGSGAPNNTQGQPLPSELQGQMEESFGTDFSAVRVFPDSPTANAGEALAMTSGNQVHFKTGQYSPGNPAGKKLLAHELAHVAQQNGGGAAASNGNTIVNDDNHLEREADLMGALAAGGQQAYVKKG